MSATTTTTIRLEDIDWDTSAKHCQIRQCTQSDVVEEYATAMKAGIEFPPIIVFTDGKSFWLVDGYHRCEAATDADICELPVDLREGDLRDAILFAVGVNATHGVRRSNADKRAAVLTLLNDESWGTWSDRKIARLCGVSQPFVSSLRKQTQSDNGYRPPEEAKPETRKPKDETPAEPVVESRPDDDGDGGEPFELSPVVQQSIDAGEAAYDEDAGDIETHESFSDGNRLGDFYESLYSRLKPILADRVYGEILTLNDHLTGALDDVTALLRELKEERGQ